MCPVLAKTLVCAPGRLPIPHQMYADDQTASEGEGGGKGEFGIVNTSSTFGLIKNNAAAVAQLSPRTFSSCSKKAAPLALQDCPKGCELGRLGSGSWAGWAGWAGLG